MFHLCVYVYKQHVFDLCVYVHSYPATILLEQIYAVANAGCYAIAKYLNLFLTFYFFYPSFLATSLCMCHTHSHN